MKNVLFLALMTFVLGASAGPITSGGGYAVVCRDSDGKIESAELLDLYEARVRGLKLMAPTGNEVRDYVRGANNTYRLQGYNEPVPAEEIAENYKKFEAIIDWLPEDEKLPDLGDLGEAAEVPEGCEIEPLAIFYDLQEQVAVDKEIWSSLNSLSRAALFTHELFYRHSRKLRIHPDVNSQDVRRVTASAYALNLRPVMSGIPEDTPLRSITHCSDEELEEHGCTEMTTYYIVVSNEGGRERARVHFTSLFGRAMVSQTFFETSLSVKAGEVFKIQSAQLLYWTAQAINDELNPGTVKFIIRRGSKIMGVLSQED